jgi:D-alanyl-lipoteichoic acid acyltransferase DltB (MBOAT superfamily)
MGMASPNRVKSLVFLVLNILFLLSVFPATRLSSSLVLLLWITSHYVSLVLMLSVSRKNLVFVCWLIFNLAWFLLVKEYHWITKGLLFGHTFPVGWSVLGYSFILFRQIHLSVNVRDGLIKSIRPLDYLNYNLAFWTFLAGPIQRYEDFIEQMRLSATQEVSAKDALKGFNRMLWGLIKMALLAPFFEKFAVVTTFTTEPNAATFLLFLLSFPLYLYLNFSGYCDAMIGLGRVVGFRIPENFRSPFVARDMIDFWNRWHISLSEFFRDYLYFPMVTAASRRFHPLASMVVAAFISFFLMGIWHGNGFHFAVFGMLHGLGVVITLLYGEFRKKIFSKEALKFYKNNGAIRVVAIVICQSYVMFTFLIFQYPLKDLRQLIAVFGGHVL